MRVFRWLCLCGLFFQTEKIQAQNLWGVNSQGGPGKGGVIYSVNRTGGNYQMRNAFAGGNPGKGPSHVTPLLLNGKLYGVTFSGGSHDGGVLFEYDLTSGQYDARFEFNSATSGANPQSSLTLFNGRLFGTALYGGGGAFSSGVIFDFDPATGQFTRRHDFNNLDPANGLAPRSRLTIAGSKLYGLAFGGASSNGIVYEYDPGSNAYLRKVEFSGTDGSIPEFGMVLGPDGKLYGTTTQGGDHNGGVIFEYVPGENGVVKRFDFRPETGTLPIGEMVWAGGKLYGMTGQSGPSGYGTLFAFDPATGQLEVKFAFGPAGSNLNACSLVLSQNGQIYGMTTGVGMHSMGTIFKFDPSSSQLTFLHEFNEQTGKFPEGGLVEMPDGTMYGLTAQGGSTNSGTLFKFDPTTKTHTRMLAFQSGTGRPTGAVAFYDGKLHGVTLDGGPMGYGVLYEYDTAANTLSELAQFTGPNGNQPHGGLVPVGNRFYGMTRFGGSMNSGTIFSYDYVTKVFQRVVDFGNSSFAEYPHGQMYKHGDKLLGMTSGGSSVIFEFDPEQATLSNKLSLPPEFFACMPSGFVGLGSALYGTCGSSSISNFIYKYDYQVGSIEVVKLLNTPLDGLFPTGTPVVRGGKLFGLTSAGGQYGRGCIYEFDPSALAYTVVYHFRDGAEGHTPDGSLMVSDNGILYGVTLAGGAHDLGVVFEFNPLTGAYSKRSDFTLGSGYRPRATSLFDAGKGLVLSVATPSAEVSIYPNPVMSTLYLSGVDQTISSVKIVDLMGRELEAQVAYEHGRHAVNVIHLARGIYFLRYSDLRGIYSLRFVKK